MTELYCMNDCTKHKVELDDNDKETLADMFGMVKFQSISSSYNEETKEIIIKLKEEEDRTKVIEQLMEEELERLKKDNNGR